MPPTVTVTQDDLAAAFTEWDRRWREDPAWFQSESDHLAMETPETYGAACAPYLLKIIEEQRAHRPNQ